MKAAWALAALGLGALLFGPKTKSAQVASGSGGAASSGGERMSNGSSSGLLLAAVRRGDYVEPSWGEVAWPAAGVVLTVGASVLRASAAPGGASLLLPATYRETIEIANRLGWIPPSAEVSDLVWASAPIALSPHPQQVSDMTTLASTERYTRAVDADFASKTGGDASWAGELRADEGKDWIVSNRNRFRVKGAPAATTYGLRWPDGRPIQPLGPDAPPAHNDEHWDYSQVLRPIRRRAVSMADGLPVDLADVYQARGLLPEVLLPFRQGEA